MKFYVGAPLRHWESARKAMSALRSMGHEVTHDWTLEAEEYFKGLSNVSNRRIANTGQALHPVAKRPKRVRFPPP